MSTQPRQRGLPPAVSEDRWCEAQAWERAFRGRQNIPTRLMHDGVLAYLGRRRP